MAALIICSDFWAQENKISHCFHIFPFYLPWSDGTACHDLSFLNVEFQASFFTFIKKLLVPFHFLSLEWYLLHIWGCWYFFQQSWFQLVIHQSCILSPCLFNFYAEYIMRNARLDEAQAGIKIARRNINNLRYADDTTLMAEIKEDLKSFLMKVKEESEKAGLKLNIHNTKIMASGALANRWGNDGYSERLYFLGLQNHCGWWLQPWN